MKRACAPVLAIFLLLPAVAAEDTPPTFTVLATDCVRAKVVFEKDQRVALEVVLTPAKARELHEFTEKYTGHSVRINISNQTVARPRVTTAITTGTVEFGIGSDEKVIQLARYLAEREKTKKKEETCEPATPAAGEEAAAE